MSAAYPPPEATMARYGDIVTDRRSCRPLGSVSVRVTGRTAPGYSDNRAIVRVSDANLVPYFEGEVGLVDNTGEVSFTVGGALGAQWIYLYFPGEERHSRYANLHVDVETHVETGDPAYDTLYPVTKEALQLSRRVFDTGRGPFVGYISGDTWQIDGVWLRDWIYHLPAYRSWEREMTAGLDRFLEKQQPDGSIPDGIRRDGTTWRAAVESDVEYILILGVWQTWQVTGDDEWMQEVLPRLEKALDYVRGDEMRWDEEHRLVKRGHTCDTWDFEIGETAEFAGKRFVAATCDQSGYYLAFRAMADMYRALGDETAAEEHEREANAYRNRANELLWDGVKYQHHYHLTPMEHPGFDEADQLAMGNTWAITRGLASPEQARSIIGEYRRRHEETGDAFPWWSLQPGYPDSLGYYGGAHLRQGGYANGGLMPWVGAELCRGAFHAGMERYGVELLRQYTDHLKASGNRVHVWFWPNGEPGMRTTNEVPHTGWGMSEWVNALVEGLAGLRDESVRLHDVEIAPRWSAAGIDSARSALRYAVNDSYVAYAYSADSGERTVVVDVTGSGERAHLHLLLPDGWSVTAVEADAVPISFETSVVGDGNYVDATVPLAGVVRVTVRSS